MIIVISSLFLLVFTGVVELMMHRSHLNKIPLRIHVNGSRGKSSIVRLIAAGLNAGGFSTFAKTTGSATRLIHPDGAEDVVRRNGMANISEQIRVIKNISQQHAQAAVIECMAIRPYLQKVEAVQIVQPHISVISNIRSDHMDVMGEKLTDIACSMLAAVPEKSELFITRETWPLLHDSGFQSHEHLHIIEPDKYNLQDHLDDFSYYEHEENLALALAVCEYLGISSRDALCGMKKATPDVGALRVLQTRFGGHEVQFINAFAANDPESIGKIWEQVGLGDIAKDRLLIVLFNARPDRILRTRQFSQFITNKLFPDHFIFIGDTGSPVEHFLKNEKPNHILDLTGMPADKIGKKIKSFINRDAVIFACGNIAGVGLQMVNYFTRDAEDS